MSHENIPCIDCVCIPICRHKPYHDLYWNCKLLSNYLKEHLGQAPYSSSNPTVFESLREILDPTGWDTAKSGNVDFQKGIK